MVSKLISLTHLFCYGNYLMFVLSSQGIAIDQNYGTSPLDHTDVLLSDSDEDLDKVDTLLHFGGGQFDRDNADEMGAYGGMGGTGGGGRDMGDAYRSRKEELDERIRRKKMEKAERLKRKEDQGASQCFASAIEGVSRGMRSDFALWDGLDASEASSMEIGCARSQRSYPDIRGPNNIDRRRLTGFGGNALQEEAVI